VGVRVSGSPGLRHSGNYGTSEAGGRSVDGEQLGKLILKHFGVPAELGYTDVGRVRVTVEMLEVPQA
jgi:hypothetical protein